MTFSENIENLTDKINSNDIKYVWDTSLLDNQKAVVKIKINDEDWFMDYDDWKLAEHENRKNPVIYGDKLILVNDEDFLELRKLEMWLKQ